MTAASAARRIDRIAASVFQASASDEQIHAMLQALAESSDLSAIAAANTLLEWQAGGEDLPKWAPAVIQRAKAIRARYGRMDRERFRREAERETKRRRETEMHAMTDAEMLAEVERRLKRVRDEVAAGLRPPREDLDAQERAKLDELAARYEALKRRASSCMVTEDRS